MTDSNKLKSVVLVVRSGKRTVLIALLAVVLSAGPTAASFEKCQSMLKTMHELVAELRGFESSQTFKVYGFAVGGPHNEWKKKVEGFRDRTTEISKPLAFIDGNDFIVPGDILMWGLEKMRCATRPMCDYKYIKNIERWLRDMKCVPKQ